MSGRRGYRSGQPQRCCLPTPRLTYSIKSAGLRDVSLGRVYDIYGNVAQEQLGLCGHRRRQGVSGPPAISLVPLHLRNAPTKLMKELGYHEGYTSMPTTIPAIFVRQHYLPDGDWGAASGLPGALIRRRKSMGLAGGTVEVGEKIAAACLLCNRAENEAIVWGCEIFLKNFEC